MLGIVSNIAQRRFESSAAVATCRFGQVESLKVSTLETVPGSSRERRNIAEAVHGWRERDARLLHFRKPIGSGCAAAAIRSKKGCRFIRLGVDPRHRGAPVNFSRILDLDRRFPLQSANRAG
jgi:hypothetical protein